MAIDTRDKRASCLFVGLPFGRVAPVPDGSITQDDFEQENYLYRGIASGAESPPIPAPTEVFVFPVWERPPFYGLPEGDAMLVLMPNGRPPRPDGSYLDDEVRSGRPPFAPGQG